MSRVRRLPSQRSVHAEALARLNELLPDDVPKALRAVTYRRTDEGWQVFWVVDREPTGRLLEIVEEARRQCRAESAPVALSVVRVPAGAGRGAQSPVLGTRVLYSRRSTR